MLVFVGNIMDKVSQKRGSAGGGAFKFGSLEWESESSEKVKVKSLQWDPWTCAAIPQLVGESALKMHTLLQNIVQN